MKRSTVLSAVVAVLILAACAALALHLHARAAPTEEGKEAAAGKGEGAGEKGGAKEEGKSEDAVAVPVAVVRSGTLAEVLRVTGTLKPLPNGESRVAAQAAGRVRSVLVKPGDRVRRGDLLVAVDRPELRLAAGQAEAGAREAQRELDALRAERETRAQALPSQERRALADLHAAQAKEALLRAGSRPEEIQRARAAVDSAQADLDRLKAGARPQEIAQAQAAVRDARAERDARRKDAERKRALHDRGIVAAKDVERAEADLTAGEANLDAKQQALDLLRAGTRPQEIRAQEGVLRQAEAQLRQAEAGARPEEIREAAAAVAAAQAGLEQARQARHELRAMDQRIRGAEARVDVAREQVRQAGVSAGRTDTRAPIEGVVTRVLVNPGDGVSEQTPVVELISQGALRAVLDVPVAERAVIRQGLQVEITVPGLPGAKYSGAVRALVAEASADTGLLPVEVWVTDPARRLTPGMPVNARLQVRRQSNRLFVPTAALFSREGDSFVYRIDGDEAHAQQVDVGGEQGEETEVVRGLRAGQRIVRDGSLSLADGTKVSARS